MDTAPRARRTTRRIRSIRAEIGLVTAALTLTLVLAPAAIATSSGSASVAPIVGRWQQSHTCDELVGALDALGLGTLAPGVIGDYFPNATPEELAAKSDICSGATPQLHSHFFTASGSSAHWISSRTRSMTARTWSWIRTPS